MRPQHQSRAIKLLSLGFSLIVALVVLVVLRKHGIPDGVVAVGAVTLGIVGSILYIQGCIALAEAKGYPGASVAAIIIVSYCCFAPLMLFIPLVLIFGLKDKTQSR
jgi:hypothetical protein